MTLQSEATAFVSRIVVAKAAASLTAQEADDHIDALVARGVLETSPTEAALIRARVPLFAKWLRRHTDLLKRTAPPTLARLPVAADEVGRDEVAPVASRLQFQGHSFSTDDVRRWCAQFGAVDDQRITLKLLRGVGERGLFDLETFYAAIRALDGMVTREAGERGIAGIKGTRN